MNRKKRRSPRFTPRKRAPKIWFPPAAAFFASIPTPALLAYLRELLRAGYDVHTSSHLRDAMLLMRITHFDIVLVGPDIPASPAAQQAFQSACAKLNVIELGGEFSTRDAGEAGAGLLEKIEARLNSKTA
jgi:hypothetical protein